MTLAELLHVLPFALPALVVLVLAPPGAGTRGIDVVGPGEDPDDVPGSPTGVRRRAGPVPAAADEPLSHQLVGEGRWGRGEPSAG